MMEETDTPELSLHEAVCQQFAIFQNLEAINRKEIIVNFVHFVMKGVSLLDPLFKELFRDVTFTGSSNEGLKIGLPNEYDVNINLNLPMMSRLKVIADTRRQHAGDVTIENFSAVLQSVLDSGKRDIYQEMESWADAEGRLILDRVLTWLQGALLNYVAFKRPLLHKKFKLKYVYLKHSGASTTLQIKLESGADIDIYIVPALVFENRNPPATFRPMPNNTLMTWYAVPKMKPRPRRKVKWNDRTYGYAPLNQEAKAVLNEDAEYIPKFGHGGHGKRRRKAKPPQQSNVVKIVKQQQTGCILWRLSFWDVEKRLLQNCPTMKTAIKMIKSLRDVHKWRRLSSYHIKTVALHEVDSHDWNKLRLDEVFVLLLRRLQFRMESNRMQYYWDDRCNLLKGAMKRTVREDIAVRLSGDLRRFTANPIELINTLRHGH